MLGDLLDPIVREIRRSLLRRSSRRDIDAVQSRNAMEPLSFEFLKDRYDYELRRKEELTAALGLPVGVLGGLGSLIVAMIRTFAFRRDAATYAFCVLVTPAICSFFACLAQLVRAYHRQKYIYLPLLKDLEATREEWRAFYEAAGYTGADQDFFSHELRMRIIEAADRNTTNNDERGSLLYWARVWLFVLLGLTTLAGVPYVANQVKLHAETRNNAAATGAAAAEHDAPSAVAVSAESRDSRRRRAGTTVTPAAATIGVAAAANQSR
jgi:hypothetical protein